jgi:hypothetical protein
MVIPEKAIQAAHAAICEQNIEDCLDPDWRGKCVKAVEAAAPHMLAAAFAYGWREGKGIPTPVDLETGELMHDQAVQSAWNPYRSQA